MNDLVKLKNNKNYSFGNENDKFKSFTNIFRNNIYYNIQLHSSINTIDINSIIGLGADLESTYTDLSPQSAVPVLTNYGSSTSTDTNCVKTYLSPDLNDFRVPRETDNYNIQFRLRRNRKCLDAPGRKKSKLKLNNCHQPDSNDYEHQAFKFNHDNHIHSKLSYNYLGRRTDVAVDVWGTDKMRDTDGVKWIKAHKNYHNDANQKFEYLPETQQIKVLGHNHCLHKHHSEDKVKLFPCVPNNDEQQWEVINKHYLNTPGDINSGFNAVKYKTHKDTGIFIL
jgi:hypothetical protein